MKKPQKLLPLAFVSSFLFGCSATSVQHVAKPDTNQPIDENETIVQLKSADYFGVSISTPVFANDKIIGELVTGDELIWKTRANSLECISLEHGSGVVGFLVHGIKLENTPISYKCFETKPKEMMTLTFDFKYPKTRMVRGIAFTPVFKQSPTYSGNTKVTVNVIDSTANDNQYKQYLKSHLENAIKNQFGDNVTSSSSNAIELEILDYKTGNAAKRWVAQSLEGSTLVKVKATIKKNDEVIETFITRPVVSSGGGFSVGADEYIFDEVAEDVFLHLFGNES